MTSFSGSQNSRGSTFCDRRGTSALGPPKTLGETHTRITIYCYLQYFKHLRGPDGHLAAPYGPRWPKMFQVSFKSAPSWLLTGPSWPQLRSMLVKSQSISQSINPSIKQSTEGSAAEALACKCAAAGLSPALQRRARPVITSFNVMPTLCLEKKSNAQLNAQLILFFFQGLPFTP